MLPDPESLAEAAAREFSDAARRGISPGGRFRVALAGGSTPRALYKRLTREPYSSEIDWTNARFFFGDERCVPPDDERSNFRMARENLFDPLRIASENVFRMAGEEEPVRAALDYEGILRNQFRSDRRPRFELVLLGLGADGHTASLFPGSPALSETRRNVVANHVASLAEWRLTLTYPILNAARRVIFLVAGEDKGPPAARILERKRGYRDLPAARVRPRRGALLWLLDEAAAKKL